MNRRNLLLWMPGLAVVAAARRARAHVATNRFPAPRRLSAAWNLPPPADGVSELGFAEMLKRPIGPRGFEPSERLLALVGSPVRIVGYMAATAQPLPGRLILAPAPVDLGGSDEAMADDLPPATVFVHLSGAAAQFPVPNYDGPIALTGRLEVGALDEPDGRVSALRLILDADASDACRPDALPLWR